MRCFPVAALAVAFIVASAMMPAIAEDDARSRSAEACRNSADEAALLACREADLAAVKAEMERQVTILAARYGEDGPEHLNVLMAAQEAWTAFYQAECHHLTWESSLGSAAAVYELECHSTLHRRRIAELQELVDSP